MTARNRPTLTLAEFHTEAGTMLEDLEYGRETVTYTFDELTRLKERALAAGLDVAEFKIDREQLEKIEDTKYESSYEESYSEY